MHETCLLVLLTALLVRGHRHGHEEVSIRPLHYDLKLRIKLPGYALDFNQEEKYTFTGHLQLMFEANSPIRQIGLHQIGLYDFNVSDVFDSNGNVVAKPIELLKNQTEQLLYIKLDRELSHGQKYQIHLRYEGPINEVIEGLYRTGFYTASGEWRPTAVTYLYPSSARRVLPCFDEPRFKTNFTVSILHPEGTRAISNGIETSIKPLRDFKPAGMENWGMITYKRIADLTTIVHEVAHQWFGNLVTCQDWGAFWLNEGFATLVHQAFHVRPYQDIFGGAKELEIPINGPNVNPRNFGHIVYEKAAGVLQMFAREIGYENFLNALNEYLRANKYKNVKDVDLLAILNKHARAVIDQHIDFTRFARTWLNQVGSPILRISQKNESHVIVVQELFRKDNMTVIPAEYAHPEFGFKWVVPIHYKLNGVEQLLAWLQPDKPLYLQCSDKDVFLPDENRLYHYVYDADLLQSSNEPLFSR